MFESLLASPVHLALVLFICAVSGCAQGMTGFGFGIVAMSLLPLAMEARTAGILVILLTALVTVKTFHAHWREFRVDRIRGLLAGAAIGAVIGSFFLVKTDPVVFRKSLGGVLLALALYDLFFARRRKLRCPSWLGFPLGTLSGALAGAFNMGGPPAVVYLYSQGWPRASVIASLQVTFFVALVIRLLMVALSGHATHDVLGLSLLSALPCLVGLWVGAKLSSKISHEQFQMMISIIILLVSVKYLFG
ncbi:MAG TPA: sulfite exporter TauE/SafE family protein [Chthoniobacteraceae bacterium]|nr:sulfite exporter TauE/SafE family protein [Chthoniobacteraceae bacterium]